MKYRKWICVFLAFSLGLTSFPGPLYSGNRIQPRVYIVEDLHFSSRCQREIVSIFHRLLKKEISVDAVCLEGAERGRLDLYPFRYLKGISPHKYKRVIDEYLRKGKITAGEYLSLRFPDLEFFGLEDPSLYWDSVRLFSKYASVLILLNAFVPETKDFLSQVQKRDETFWREVNDVLTKSSVVVVICGGFHSQALMDHLKRHHIPFQRIRPRVFVLDPKEKYTYVRDLAGLGKGYLSLPVSTDFRISFARFWNLWSKLIRDLKLREAEGSIGWIFVPRKIRRDAFSLSSRLNRRVFSLVAEDYDWSILRIDSRGLVRSLPQDLRVLGINPDAFFTLAESSLFQKFPGQAKAQKSVIHLAPYLLQRAKKPSVVSQINETMKDNLKDRLPDYLDWFKRTYGLKGLPEDSVIVLLWTLFTSWYLTERDDSWCKKWVDRLSRLEISLPEDPTRFEERVRSVVLPYGKRLRWISNLRWALKLFGNIDYFVPAPLPSGCWIDRYISPDRRFQFLSLAKSFGILDAYPLLLKTNLTKAQEEFLRDTTKIYREVKKKRFSGKGDFRPSSDSPEFKLGTQLAVLDWVSSILIENKFWSSPEVGFALSEEIEDYWLQLVARSGAWRTYFFLVELRDQLRFGLIDVPSLSPTPEVLMFLNKVRDWCVSLSGGTSCSLTVRQGKVNLTVSSSEPLKRLKERLTSLVKGKWEIEKGNQVLRTKLGLHWSAWVKLEPNDKRGNSFLSSYSKWLLRGGSFLLSLAFFKVTSYPIPVILLPVGPINTGLLLRERVKLPSGAEVRFTVEGSNIFAEKVLEGRSQRLYGAIRYQRKDNHILLEDESRWPKEVIQALVSELLSQKKNKRYSWTISFESDDQREVWRSVLERRGFSPIRTADKELWIPRVYFSLSIWAMRMISHTYPRLLTFFPESEIRSRLGDCRSREEAVEFLETMYSQLARKMELYRRQGEENKVREIVEIMETVRAGLRKMEDVWRRVDVNQFVRRTVADLSKKYKGIKVEVESKVKRKLYTYSLFKRLLYQVLENAFVHGGKRVKVKVWFKEGNLWAEVLDYGKGIPLTQRDVLFSRPTSSSLEDSKSAGHRLPMLVDSLRNLGGDLYLFSLSGEEKVLETTSLGDIKLPSDFKTGTVVRFSIPAFSPGRSVPDLPRYDLVLVAGNFGSGRHWVARYLTARFGLYFVSLDSLLMFFLKRMSYTYPDLWALIQEEKEEDLVLSALEKAVGEFVKDLRFKEDGIYFKGFNTSLYLNETGLLDEVFHSRKVEEFLQVMDVWGELIESTLLNQIEANFQDLVYAMGFTGFVVKTWFDTIKREEIQSPEGVRIGLLRVFKEPSQVARDTDISYSDLLKLPFPSEKVSRIPWNVLSDALSTSGMDLLSALIFTRPELSSIVRKYINRKNSKVIISLLSKEDLPLEYKLRLLDAVEGSMLAQAKIIREFEAIQDLEKDLKDWAFSQPDRQLRHRVVELIRRLYLYRVQDVVRNNILVPLRAYYLRALKKLKNGEDKHALSVALDRLTQMDKEISQVLAKLQSTSWDETTDLYMEVLVKLREIVKSAEELKKDLDIIAPYVTPILPLADEITRRMLFVESLSDVEVNGEKDYDIAIPWQAKAKVNFKVRAYVPGMNSLEFSKLKEEISKKIYVVARLARVEKVGADWKEEVTVPLHLSGFEEKGKLGGIVYSGDLNVGDLGPGIYELTFSCIYPAGRIWWEDEGREKIRSEENPFGNVVIRVTLPSGRIDDYVSTLKTRFNLPLILWFTIDKYGNGYIATYNQVRQKEGVEVFLRLDRVEGLVRQIESGRARITLTPSGEVICFKRDLTGKFAGLQLKGRNFDSLEDLFTYIKNWLEERCK